MSEQMRGEYAWVESRLRATELYRHGPSAVVEQRIIDVFRAHPALVVEAIEHVGRRFESGQVRSPWVILAKHVEEAVRPLEDVHATDERDREKATRRAEAWVRSAGKHFDRAPEVLDDLFEGPDSRLKAWRSDEALRQRMAKLWREARPEGELISEQAEERAARWMAAKVAKPRVAEEPEPALAEPEPSVV